MSILSDHHIILDRFRNYDAFKGIDKQTFDIDGPENRIYLPADREVAAKLDVSPHPSRHVTPYSEKISEKLEEIARTIPNPKHRVVEIKTLIDAIRVGFINRDLYTNVPIGKTREEVDRGVEKVLTDPKAYLAQYPDQLRAIRDIEQRGANAGQNHLIKWLLYLDHPERERVLDEVIARNPGVNITAGNQELAGTKWQPKSTATDAIASLLQTPGSTAPNPRDFPPLPGYSLPSLAGLNEQEGFTRSDPRFNGQLPAFPAPGPDEKQFDQLPPTTAASVDPLVLRSDPASGAWLPFYENPLAGGSFVGQNPVPLLAGAAAAGLAAPFVPPWLLTLGGFLALSKAATAQDGSPDTKFDADTPGGGVFSTGTTASAALGSGLKETDHSSGYSNSPTSGSQVDRASSLVPEVHASSFADRFGNWTSTPNGVVPAEGLPEAGLKPSAGSAAPEEVRHLARVNESNAGSVFTSGSAPVPHLPSTAFNERFGSWTAPIAAGNQPPASKSIGAFADEPSYLIPPPIFGVEGTSNPRNDAEEWFSRWIRPFIHPE